MFEKLPQEWKDMPFWINWTYVYSPNRPKPLKVPVDQNGSPIDITRTWFSYSAALSATETSELNLGFVFTGNGIVGIDIDSTNPREWAYYFGSYTEVSPSGNGIHVILKNSGIPGTKRRKGTYEIYDNKRYFTVTGERISRETDIKHVDITEFYNLYINDNHRTRAIHQPTYNSEPFSSSGSSFFSSPLIRDLLEGRWVLHFPSQSEAELSFFSTALKSMSVPQAVTLYKNSRLYRSKWEERRGNKTYGQITIERALR